MHAVAFSKNSLSHSSSVGEILRIRREAFGLDRTAIEAALTISKRNIAALEEDRFEDIPEELYRECFLKNYAVYLGFDWNEVKHAYRVQTALYHPSLEKEEKSAPTPGVKRFSFWVPSRMIKNGALTGIISLCALYLGWLGYGIVSPPALVVTAPTDNVSVHDGSVLISGTTESDATVMINGLPVIKESTGAFRQDVMLLEGLNTITIVAAKKYSASSHVTRSIVYRRGDVSYKSK
ncbi:helix-turn-helix domain-containing protein [Candidatus Uhrbacteria bacterium]|nr:helix-turn-helix domain-containing protein [Candidatus Uhrbacteria bacterium]